MRHPTFGWGNDVRACFCRQWTYSACPQWWQCCCHRGLCYRLWAMLHSVASARNLLRGRFDLWQRLSLTTRACGWGWCCHADMLDFVWRRTFLFECRGRWFGLGDTQKDCPWNGLWTSQISSSFCQMGSCWPKSAIQIQEPQLLLWLKVYSDGDSHDFATAITSSGDHGSCGFDRLNQGAPAWAGESQPIFH